MRESIWDIVYVLFPQVKALFTEGKITYTTGKSDELGERNYAFVRKKFLINIFRFHCPNLNFRKVR